jgi:putative tryptophan/tyrosine transport system substrate-binding protein
MMKEAEATGLTLGLYVRFVAVQGPGDLDRAFSTIAAESTDAIWCSQARCSSLGEDA